MMFKNHQNTNNNSCVHVFLLINILKYGNYNNVFPSLQHATIMVYHPDITVNIIIMIIIIGEFSRLKYCLINILYLTNREGGSNICCLCSNWPFLICYADSASLQSRRWLPLVYLHVWGRFLSWVFHQYLLPHFTLPQTLRDYLHFVFSFHIYADTEAEIHRLLDL